MPAMKTFRLPRMSASLPIGTRNMAAARRYAVAIQLRLMASAENSLPIDGMAMCELMHRAMLSGADPAGKRHLALQQHEFSRGVPITGGHYFRGGDTIYIRRRPLHRVRRECAQLPEPSLQP